MARRGKKILEEIHPLHIIREVQRWPALYVKDNTERSSTHFALKIWREVAKSLFPEWESFTKAQKNAKITDLTKKWRNLRDTFKRHVEIEKKIREGHDIKKKVYVYYNHMSFLLPHIAGDDDDRAAPARARARTRSDDAPPAPDALAAPAAPAAPDRASPPRLSLDDPPASSVFLEEIDEDKHFVMSLIPSLKKMTEDEKLTAKVEILKVIKGIRNKSNTTTPPRQAADTLAFTTVEVLREGGHIKTEFHQDDVDLGNGLVHFDDESS